jgi:hypothetical protein
MNKHDQPTLDQVKPTIAHTLGLLSNNVDTAHTIIHEFKHSESKLLERISDIFTQCGCVVTIKLVCTHKCTDPDCLTVECDPHWEKICFHDTHTDECATYNLSVVNKIL